MIIRIYIYFMIIHAAGRYTEMFVNSAKWVAGWRVDGAELHVDF